MKRFLPLLLVLSFVFLLPAAAAEPEYFVDLGFEDQEVGKAPDQSAIFACVPLKASLKVAQSGNRKVLAFSRATADGNTAAYVDLMTGSRKLAKIHVLSYDIMIPKKLTTAGTWQIACSRQTPAAGTQFQQAGSLNLVSGEIVYASKAVATLEFGKWYNLAVVFDEYRSIYDIYVDGACVVSAAPYTINTAAAYPERIRFGQNSSAGECLVYADNIRIYNASVPVGIPAADVNVIAAEETAEPAGSEIEIPVWTRQRDINAIVVSAVGSVSIVLVGILAVIVLLRGRKGKPGDPSSPSNT